MLPPDLSMGPGFTGTVVPYVPPGSDIPDLPSDNLPRIELDPNRLARNSAETGAVGLPPSQTGEDRAQIEDLMRLASFGFGLYSQTRRPDGSVGGPSQATRDSQDIGRPKKRGDVSKPRGKGKGLDTGADEKAAANAQGNRAMPVLMAAALGLVLWLVTGSPLVGVLGGVVGAVVLSFVM